MEFRKDDIIRIRPEYFNGIKDRLFFSQNLFFFDGYDESHKNVLLRNLNVQIPVEDVSPVKMDGEEDRDIFYSPKTAADVFSKDEPLRCRHIEEGQYYLEALKKCKNDNGTSYYDIIKNLSLEYVHELQHTLPEVGNDLEINYRLSPYVKRKLTDIARVVTYKKYEEDKDSFKDFIKVYIDKKIVFSDPLSHSIDSDKTAFVLLFEDRYEARYAEFYINSAIGKLFLLPNDLCGNLKGTLTVSSINKLVLRWNDEYKECCVLLESLLQYLLAFREKLSEKQSAMAGVIGFLSQVRNGMVMEMVMPDLFEKAHISVLKKWKENTGAVMSRLNLEDDNLQTAAPIIGELIEALTTTDNGVISEMSKFRIYLSEFMKFAEENSSKL